MESRRKSRKRNKDELQKKREKQTEPSSFQLGAEKARVGHTGGERQIALYGPQLSAGLDRGCLEKRIFSRSRVRSHRLVKLAYIAPVQRWRTSLPFSALANCCADIGCRFVQFTRHFRRYVIGPPVEFARSLVHGPIAHEKSLELCTERHKNATMTAYQRCNYAK